MISWSDILASGGGACIGSRIANAVVEGNRVAVLGNISSKIEDILWYRRVVH